MKLIIWIYQLSRLTTTSCLLSLSICLGFAHAIEIIPDGRNVFYRNPNERDCPKTQERRIKYKRSLQYGQGICVGKESAASVLCDRNRPIIPVFEDDNLSISEICIPPPNPQLDDPKTIRKGGIDESIPYIISPRYTLIKNQRPSFRWHGIGSSIRYEIILYKFDQGEQEEVWSLQYSSSGEEIEILVYPADKESLIPGNDYQLVVRVVNSNVSSDQEVIDPAQYDVNSRSVSGLRFRLLSQKTVQEIEKNAQEIKGSQLRKESKAITLSVFYAMNNLYSDAIEELEKSIKEGFKEFPIYLTLGEFYAKSGLNSLSKETYMQAIAKAKNEDEKKLAREALNNLCKEVGDELCKR